MENIEIGYKPSEKGHHIKPFSDDSGDDFEYYKAATPAWLKSRARSTKFALLFRYVGVLAAAVVVSAVTTLLVSHATRAPLSAGPPPPDNSLNAITNSTLGFHKIYSISLPNHWHKHDAQLLAARHTGFDIENVQGVMWDAIGKTEYPVGWHDPYYASIGCWRAHLNVLTKIVEEGIGSALM
jgi:hypothetical protein